MESKTTRGLCVHTLNYLESKLAEIERREFPMGVFGPTGELVTPDYNCPSYGILNEIQMMVKEFVSDELNAMDEYYKEEANREA